MRNPFHPGSGTLPKVLAGRDDQVNEFQELIRGVSGRKPNVRLTGLRGVGKSVLLQQFRDIAEQDNWSTLVVEATPERNSEDKLSAWLSSGLDELHKQLSVAHRTRKLVGHSSSFASVQYDDFSVRLSDTQSTVPLAQRLTELVDISVQHKKAGLVMMVDEAQVIVDDNPRGSLARDGQLPLSGLLAAVTSVQGTGRPFALVLSGLPTLVGNLLRARTYTERMFRGLELRSLDEAPAIEALTGPLRDSGIAMDHELVQQVVREVEGYPYFLQVYGAELWAEAYRRKLDTIRLDVLDRIRPSIVERLDDDFYQARIAYLTRAEVDLLLSTAACHYPPLLASDMQRASAKSVNNVNNLIGRLIEKGLIYRSRKGEYYYTVPGFHEFLGRYSEHG